MAETKLTNKFFTYEVDSDGIGVITIDQKDNPTNLFSYGFIEEYISTAHKAIAVSYTHLTLPTNREV